MKKIIFFSLVIVLIIGSCKQEKKSLVEGAWKLDSWERFRGDTLVAILGKDAIGGEIKIFSQQYFVFRGRYQADTTISDNFGGGTYKIDGNHYEETYLNFLDLQRPPTDILKLLIELRDDTLIQTWPCDENWQVNKSKYYNIQKYIRLD
jgi:hypothetical protein